MTKGAEAYRSISEVSDLLETPQHVLRFWESRFPQIKPMKSAGGRRHYRPADVALLTGIKVLLHDQGLSVRGVQKLLREQGVRHVMALGGGGMAATAPAEAPAEAPVVAQPRAAVVAFPRPVAPARTGAEGREDPPEALPEPEAPVADMGAGAEPAAPAEAAEEPWQAAAEAAPLAPESEAAYVVKPDAGMGPDAAEQPEVVAEPEVEAEPEALAEPEAAVEAAAASPMAAEAEPAEADSLWAEAPDAGDGDEADATPYTGPLESFPMPGSREFRRARRAARQARLARQAERHARARAEIAAPGAADASLPDGAAEAVDLPAQPTPAESAPQAESLIAPAALAAALAGLAPERAEPLRPELSPLYRHLSDLCARMGRED